VCKFKEGSGLGISLEGTVDVEDGVEVHPHHYIRSILPDGPVDVTGRLQAGDELLQVNDAVLYGHNHVEVVAVLRDSPRHVRIVCARPRDTVDNLRCTAAAPHAAGVPHSLFKAKSEQVLVPSPAVVASDVGIVGRSHSLEPLGGLATWGAEVVTVELYKGDRGLGFSILDYQVRRMSVLFSYVSLYLSVMYMNLFITHFFVSLDHRSLVHGQVTIIFVVSVCLSVCLFVQSFSQPCLIRFRSN